MNDQDFLSKAVEIGNRKPAPYNFGAVVVKDGEIISADHNHVHETNDPSLHAEVSAIVSACKKLGSHNIDGAVLYASHEPCLMCFCCAAWANIDRIVFVTPASEKGDSSYRFRNQNIFELAKSLIRPMEVKQVNLS